MTCGGHSGSRTVLESRRTEVRRESAPVVKTLRTLRLPDRFVHARVKGLEKLIPLHRSFGDPVRSGMCARVYSYFPDVQDSRENFISPREVEHIRVAVERVDGLCRLRWSGQVSAVFNSLDVYGVYDGNPVFVGYTAAQGRDETHGLPTGRIGWGTWLSEVYPLKAPVTRRWPTRDPVHVIGADPVSARLYYIVEHHESEQRSLHWVRRLGQEKGEGAKRVEWSTGVGPGFAKITLLYVLAGQPIGQPFFTSKEGVGNAPLYVGQHQHCAGDIEYWKDHVVWGDEFISPAFDRVTYIDVRNRMLFFLASHEEQHSITWGPHHLAGFRNLDSFVPSEDLKLVSNELILQERRDERLSIRLIRIRFDPELDMDQAAQVTPWYSELTYASPEEGVWYYRPLTAKQTRALQRYANTYLVPGVLVPQKRGKPKRVPFDRLRWQPLEWKSPPLDFYSEHTNPFCPLQ